MPNSASGLDPELSGDLHGIAAALLDADQLLFGTTHPHGPGMQALSRLVTDKCVQIRLADHLVFLLSVSLASRLRQPMQADSRGEPMGGQ